MENINTTAKRKPKPRDIEAKFDVSELFFSTTDRKGIIQYGNNVFARVSGYTRAELIGAPHSIIRHPEMPRVVFKLLWDYLLSGRSIAAYVKNMSASGSYYWVLAIATPIKDGLLSIRLKPSSELFPIVSDAYKVLLEIEKQHEAEGFTRGEAMAASGDRLMKMLASLGFDSYDKLMNTMLIREVESRKKILATGGKNSRIGNSGHFPELQSSCSQLSNEVSSMFNKIELLLNLDKELQSKAVFMQQLSTALQRLSLNAQVRATWLGADGATLQVIADQMNSSARALGDSTSDICKHMDQTNAVLRDAASSIATGDISVEMMTFFLQELAVSNASMNEEQKLDIRQRIRELAEVVEAKFEIACKTAIQVTDQITTLEKRLDNFIKQVRTLEILHVTGRVEAVRATNGSDVSIIFEEVHEKTRETREKLTQLVELIGSARFEPPKMMELNDSLRVLRAA